MGRIGISLLSLGLAGCALLGDPGTSWNRPQPVHQVLATDRYWVLLSPQAKGSTTEIRLCLKRVAPQVPVTEARIMISVALLDQGVESLDLRYDPLSQCYRGLLPRPITTTRGYLAYVQIGQERHRWMFR